MNRKFLLSTILTVALCLSLAGHAFGQVITVGVLPGNVFKYKVTYGWSSSDPTATPPAGWVSANSTEYYQVTVTAVTTTVVQLATVQHFLNGTDINRDELVDVSTSQGGSMLVYASSLSAGSSLYPAATDIPLKVESTVSRPYGSGYRDTNYITASLENVEGYVSRFMSLYFDKASGVLVDAFFEDVGVDKPEQKFSRTIKITDSSLWTVAGTPPDGSGDGNGWTGGLPIELILGVAAAIVVVVVVWVVVLVLRKRGKNKKR